jgi:prevent-host-death family protein
MKTIAQRELRNRSGEVLRRAEQGETFTVTVSGRAVAQLGPLRRPQWVPRAEYVRTLVGRADTTLFTNIRRLARSTRPIEDRWKG